MFDDFFIRALIAGIGIALVAGPLGCFVVWRRLSYFGDTLAHSALLGAALAVFLQANTVITVFVVSVIISLLLLFLQKGGGLASDALLGLLSHSSLAIGLVAIAFMTWVRIDLNALLFGDILAVSKSDLIFVWTGGVGVLGILLMVWKPLFAATVNEELALAEGMNPDRYNIIFMLLMACIIAISMKIVGVLLITALLIIPAATARRLSSSPELMAVYSAIIGIIAVWGGLYGSLYWDAPSGPSIVIMALLLFILTFVPVFRNERSKQER